MSDQTRIGIIGTSGYAELLLSLLATCEDAEIAAVCGRTRSTAEAVASKYPSAAVFTDYNDLIKRGRLDGIIIASPDDLHYPMTIAALEAGLHVLCEKPLAFTVTQAQEMLERAEEAGVKHMVEFTWRWMPHYQYLHNLVAGGYLGQGYDYHYRFWGNRGRVNDYTWRFDPRRSIGVLGDIGSHMIEMALWIHGDIVNVGAHLASFSKRIDLDGETINGANESALLAVEFADGAQGMIHVSTVAHTAARGREQHVTLHGAGGSLETEWRYGGAEGGVVVRGCRHDEEDFQVLAIPDEYQPEAGHGREMIGAVMSKHLVGPRLFVDAIRRDYLPTPSFIEGYKVQQVLDAAMKSHQSGQRVEIHPFTRDVVQ